MQNLDATLRGATTQDKILDAIVDRLRESVDVYNDQNCWVSDDPIPLSHPGGEEFCTVSFGDGIFPPEFFTGGGELTLVEMGSIVIAPTIRQTGDRPRRKARRIATDSENRNLLYRKLQILKSLFKNDWEPAFETQPLLRDLPNPTRCSSPAEVMVGEIKMIQFRLTISTVFDWDLSDG